MGRIAKSIEIGAPPEKVWEMLAFDRWSEWQVVGGIGLMQIENARAQLFWRFTLHL